MKQLKNTPLKGKHNKPIITDFIFKDDALKKPVVVFCHGYKGFKDWGAWNLMAETFAKADIFFVKFNFSHNGGTLAQPIDFPDLEAFGNNNYTKELDDLESVLDVITAEDFQHKENADLANITLIGHSRGGGIVSIKAEEDVRVSRVITLASVSEYKARFPRGKELEQWKQDGVMHVVNGRTKQKMPHYIQFLEDYTANSERLSISRAQKNLNKPQLIIHGTNDSSVKYYNAENLKNWNEDATLRWIANADHVFNTQHPWEKEVLSEQLSIVVEKCIGFVKEN